MDATEYALRKVVQNHVVREVDEVRQREMWQWACIGVLFVLVLLVSAWLQIYFVQRGYAVADLQRERAAEEEINRKLRLEIEMRRSPNVIESKAIDRLHMVWPAQDQAIVIERVVPAPHPASSVVAAAR